MNCIAVLLEFILWIFYSLLGYYQTSIIPLISSNSTSLIVASAKSIQNSHNSEHIAVCQLPLWCCAECIHATCICCVIQGNLSKNKLLIQVAGLSKSSNSIHANRNRTGTVRSSLGTSLHQSIDSRWQCLVAVQITCCEQWTSCLIKLETPNTHVDLLQKLHSVSRSRSKYDFRKMICSIHSQNAYDGYHKTWQSLVRYAFHKCSTLEVKNMGNLIHRAKNMSSCAYSSAI